MEVLCVESFFFNTDSKAKVHRAAVFWGDWGAEKVVTWIRIWKESRAHADGQGEKALNIYAGEQSVLKQCGHWKQVAKFVISLGKNLYSPKIS